MSGRFAWSWSTKGSTPPSGPQWGSIAAKIGCTAETLRKWVRQAERDGGTRPGLTTAERDRIKQREECGDGFEDPMDQANGLRLRKSASFGDAEIAWYENLGDGGFAEPRTIGGVVLTAYSVYASDLDGDGDLDVLAGTLNDSEVAWYENSTDGVGDACDVCPTVPDPGQDDADADGAGDSCDSCPWTPDDQTNTDYDPRGDACDCDPDSDQAWSPPGTIDSLKISHHSISGATTLGWLAPVEAGSVSLQFDVLRSSAASDLHTQAICLASDQRET